MLTDRPDKPPLLVPEVPFLLTARWQDGPEDGYQVYIAAAEYPGAPPREYAIGESISSPVMLVERAELPITLQLIRDPDAGGWRFDYLGGPEYFTPPPPVSELAPNVAPTPMAPAQLSAQAEAMLRESIGIPPGSSIPEPAGPLPPEERSGEPYRFDPTPHMDLQTAEPAPPIPPPAPPGPEPTESPRLPAPVPPPGKPLGTYGDQTVPFAH